MYVQRDADGNIALVGLQANGECTEYVASGDPELVKFMDSVADSGSQHSHMHESDLAFVRVLEDVIDVLIEKGVIRFTDLPKAAQDKLSQRQSLRSQINSLGLLADEDDQGVI